MEFAWARPRAAGRGATGLRIAEDRRGEDVLRSAQDLGDGGEPVGLLKQGRAEAGIVEAVDKALRFELAAASGRSAGRTGRFISAGGGVARRRVCTG